MLSSSAQTTLAAQAFRPYEDRWPADQRFDAREFHARPSLTQSARRMLRRWPTKDQQTQLTRRPA